MNRNAVSLIETLARHPLQSAPMEVCFATPTRAERATRVWAQLSRAVKAFPEQAADTARALRKQAASYLGQDDVRSEAAGRAAAAIEVARMRA